MANRRSFVLKVLALILLFGKIKNANLCPKQFPSVGIGCISRKKREINLMDKRGYQSIKSEAIDKEELNFETHFDAQRLTTISAVIDEEEAEILMNLKVVNGNSKKEKKKKNGQITITKEDPVE